jgi:Glycosyl transferase family 2
VRLVDASPTPDDWNGKAWNLYVGLERAGADVAWILTVDADVRPAPLLVRSLLAHARRTGLAAFSVATRQEVSGVGEALLHPALLTTLVYRFGLPGGATSSPRPCSTRSPVPAATMPGGWPGWDCSRARAGSALPSLRTPTPAS